MEIIKNFEAHSSQVELVEDGGSKFVLKTSDPEEINNEKRFLNTLKEHGLPSLEVVSKSELKSNQILLEYIDGSKAAVVESETDFIKWGTTVKNMHDIHFDYSFKIDSSNIDKKLDWNIFLGKLFEQTLHEQSQKGSLSKENLDRISRFVNDRSRVLSVGAPYSLLHGDLHTGNTLDKNGKIVIYDKSSEVFAGDPVYDFVTMVSHYPNGSYLNVSDARRQNDKNLLDAFVKGYGKNVLADDRDKLDLYLMIKGLSRYPNPFEPFLKEMFLEVLYRHGY